MTSQRSIFTSLTIITAATGAHSVLAASGCRAGVDRALLEDILQNPNDYYVNVHNATYQPGAVRGQLEH